MGTEKKNNATPEEIPESTKAETTAAQKQTSSEDVNNIVDRRIDALLLDELDRWEELLDRDEAPVPPGLTPRSLSSEELDRLLREDHGFND